ncbi:MAG: VOC family protein [Moheibacter sp.]
MNKEKAKHGSINWRDLTHTNADELRNFYSKVAGWTFEGIPMEDEQGEYEDYVMKAEGNSAVAGICHNRGVNTEIPPQWIMYISVENIKHSLGEALNLGGKIIKEYTSKEGELIYVMIQDPKGTLFALAQI